VTRRKPVNVSASVRQRLLNVARAQNEDFQLVLTQYASERLLYRLSQSEHRDVFVLKGAMLFALWGGRPHRPTRDLDFLGRGENSADRFTQLFQGVCRLDVQDDGLDFRGDTVRCEVIRRDEEYEGLRIKLDARLARARIPIQVDIGFGDVITPCTRETAYPTILDFPAPVISVYPRETVVAEKFQAMVMLGMANSRMKDFYDLWIIARRFEFQGPLLSQAIRATFERRQTPVPSKTPIALSPDFIEDRAKRIQWRAFVGKSRLHEEAAGLEEVASLLRDFLLPPTEALARGRLLEMTWSPSGPWVPARAG